MKTVRIKLESFPGGLYYIVQEVDADGKPTATATTTPSRTLHEDAARDVANLMVANPEWEEFQLEGFRFSRPTFFTAVNG